METPAAEVDIDETLVRGLLAEQHPDLTGLDLALLDSGWDNVIYRLGPDLTLRMPRRAMAAPLVLNELKWLPLLAPRLPIPIPAPLRAGRPGLGYPWSWSVCPWFPGTIAAASPPEDPHAAALALGEFLAALHQPAPDDAPPNLYRGGPLSDRATATIERIERLGDAIDAAAARAVWEAAAALPRWEGPPLWLHGDLHPANVLVHEGRISAVIDFGDITGGDPATDLAVAWLLLPAEARADFRAAAGGCDDDTWGRSKGWALYEAVTFIASSADNPTFTRVGETALAAVLADPP